MDLETIALIAMGGCLFLWLVVNFIITLHNVRIAKAAGLTVQVQCEKCGTIYEVTGKELDTLVDTAWKQDGVIGSRMTGAGFGGCTVSIVKEDAVKSFIENVGKIYEEKIGYKADFYVVEIGDGAGIWE